MDLVLAYVAGVASCIAVLFLIVRRSGRTGPNSRVVTRESVSAVLTTGRRPSP